jgi:hypothetical protein
MSNVDGLLPKYFLSHTERAEITEKGIWRFVKVLPGIVERTIPGKPHPASQGG